MAHEGLVEYRRHSFEVMMAAGRIPIQFGPARFQIFIHENSPGNKKAVLVHGFFIFHAARVLLRTLPAQAVFARPLYRVSYLLRNLSWQALHA